MRINFKSVFKTFTKSQFLLALMLCIGSVISSCKKDDDKDTSPTPFNRTGGLYISSEGSFQSANASLTYYNPASNEVVDDVFKQVNGRSVGDVLQSMRLINGSLYLVVNNSGKIEVCNPNTLKSITTISGFTSPRYILQRDSGEAYVSDLASNQISVLNLGTNSVSSHIGINGWTEQMAYGNGNVYVTNFSTEYLYKINPALNQVTDSIHISKGAGSIVHDVNGKLWVLCGGDYFGAYNGALYRIDPASNSIEMSLHFNANEFPTRLCLNSTADQLFYINNNVYKMGIGETSLPATPFIQSNANSFYGIGVDPSNNDVYISDAIDFVQKGKVYRYTSTGTLLKTINTGIAPGDFLFF